MPATDTVKIVLNDAWGCFGLSDEALDKYAMLADLTYSERKALREDSIERTDPILVQVVEGLGEAAHWCGGALKIAELPKGAQYRILDEDGKEDVQTPDQITWLTA